MFRQVFNDRLRFRRRWKHLIFAVLRLFVLPALRLSMQLKVYGFANIPRSGGALVIANHVHNADPVLILSASTRPVHWMAKKEVWDLPVLRWIATHSGAFPVDRGTFDRVAIRTAVDTIQEGLLVGMFPEGTRSVTGGLREPFAGASLVALRSEAPIIPCAIIGTEDLPLNGAKQQRRVRRYPKVQIYYGPPFILRSRGDDGRRFTMADLTTAMMIELARILPPSRRGLYNDIDITHSHPAVVRPVDRFPGA